MPRWCALIAFGIAAVACSDRSRSEPPPAPASGSVATTADAAALPPFSVDDAVRLFEAVAVCRLEPHGLDHMCDARNALDAAYGMDLDPKLTRYDTVAEAARRVLGHASPAVRTRAFDQLDADQDEALLVRALGAETDPMALRAMIFVAHTSTEYHAPIVDAVLAHIDHPVPEVRLAAMSSLAHEYNVGYAGLFEAIAQRITDDRDAIVRADACMRLGLLQDPRSIAVFDRMLVASTTPPLFDACGEGLVYTWLGDPAREHPVEAGYRRTLVLLRAGPYRPGAPGTRTLEAVRGLARAHRVFDDLPPWLDLADAREALAAVAATPRADVNARRVAAETIGELRPTVAELRRYRARVRDRSAIADEVREHLTDAESWIDDPPP